MVDWYLITVAFLFALAGDIEEVSAQASGRTRVLLLFCSLRCFLLAARLVFTLASRQDSWICCSLASGNGILHPFRCSLNITPFPDILPVQVLTLKILLRTYVCITQNNLAVVVTPLPFFPLRKVQYSSHNSGVVSSLYIRLQKKHESKQMERLILFPFSPFYVCSPIRMRISWVE